MNKNVYFSILMHWLNQIFNLITEKLVLKISVNTAVSKTTHYQLNFSNLKDGCFQLRVNKQKITATLINIYKYTQLTNFLLTFSFKSFFFHFGFLLYFILATYRGILWGNPYHIAMKKYIALIYFLQTYLILLKNRIYLKILSYSFFPFLCACLSL